MGSRFRLLASFLLVLALHNALLSGAVEAAARAQDPPVRPENVRFEVAEGGVVRVFYDIVAANPQQVVSVRLLASQDGGKTFDITAKSVSGDAGAAVLPGPAKQITWEAARDVERLDAALLRFQIVVTAITAIEEPQRFWGVTGGFLPHSGVPSALSGSLFNAEQADLRGSEFRVGIVRGRPDGRDWGVSVVLKQLKTGSSLVRAGYDGDAIAKTTYRVRDSLWGAGAEVHTFLPFLRAGRRAWVGVLLGAGMSTDYSGNVDRRTEGTIYATNPRAGGALTTVTAGPGYIQGYRGDILEVGPGQTAVEDVATPADLHVSGWDLDAQLLARGELAAAFALPNRLKFRVSGGFNFPGIAAFNVEIAHFFGGP
jgi:hypothetical protein